MCDVFAAIGVKNGNVLRQFMKHGADKLVGYGNKHGIGYTAIAKDKSIFGERWLNPDKVFTGKPVTDTDIEVIKELGDIMENIPELNSYNKFGSPKWSQVSSVIFHARFATCDKSMENVHPFNDKNDSISLIHNGTISNHAMFKKRYSTCDSESILTQYMAHDVPSKRKNINNVFKDLRGAFTVMATSIDANGNRVVDIFKDDGRALYVTKIDNLGGIVFTSEPKVITEACEKMKWNHKNAIVKVKNFTFCRFDAVTGKLIGKAISIDELESRRSLPQNNNESSFSAGHFPSRHEKNNATNNAYSGNSNQGTESNNKAKGSESNRNDGTTNRSNLGIVDRSGVCSVAEFFANETDIDVASDFNNDVQGDSKETKIPVVDMKTGEIIEVLPEVPESELEASDSKYNAEKTESYDIQTLLDNEASDSKYSYNFQQMSAEDIETLEDYSARLTEEELDILDELPDDVRLSFIKNHYNDNVGPLN